MSDKDPLLEWNRLNKENAEQEFASALFFGMTSTSPLADKFSMWLFAGTGATSALLITQISTIIESLSLKGFRMCMFMLIASALSAFIAKYYALRCQIQNDLQTSLNSQLAEIFNSHEESEDRILEIAEKRGIELETEIELQNVINEFKKPFPFWVQWLITRSAKKTEGNRQAGYQYSVKAYYKQLNYTFFQAAFFMGFMCAGGWYAGGL